MNTGQIISGAGHLGLIGWAFFGGVFAAQPEPVEVTEVTAISAEDFAALYNQDTPEVTESVTAPEQPEVEETLPEVSAEEDVPQLETPEETPVVEPDPVPEPPQEPVETVIEDDAPVLEEPSEEIAALLPEVSEEPQPDEAPRVAPEPVAQPEPDQQIDEVVQEEVVPDEADTQAPEQEATAQEEATTEIVTEAEEPAGAPTTSLRPKSRPERAATAAVQDAVSEALEETGQAEAQVQPAPTGPPLSRGEKDALRVAVQQCWNVGSLSTDALNTTVVVGVAMSEDGKPKVESIKMLSAQGGSDSAARQAYEAARRAIIRCGARGYDLPADKYDQWRDIEMTFNPERMRIK